MKFLFINPPEGYGSPGKEIDLYYRFSPPLGILYLAKVLEEKGHKIEILDFGAEKFSEEKILKNINSIDAIGLTINVYNIKNIPNIINLVKSNDRHLPVIIGGPLCSIQPKQTLIESNADICVDGEAELIIDKIANALIGNGIFSDIPGIFYKTGDVIKKGPPAEVIKNIDSLQFPARHLVDKYEYGYYAGIHLSKGKFTSIITSRGCPYHCKFCCVCNIVKEHRQRSAENIIKELDELNQNYTALMIVDDNFVVDEKRVEKIMDLLIEKKFDLDISIMGIRVDTVNGKLFKKMKKAGISYVFMGLESGNQDVLNFYNKKINLGQMKNSIQICRKIGIFTHGNFIVGAPVETEEHLDKTLKMAKKLPLNLATFIPLQYLKGSELWDIAYKEGKIKENEYVVNNDPTRGLGNFSHEYLKQWGKEATKHFILRPGHLLQEFFLTVLRKDFSFLKEPILLTRNKISGYYNLENKKI